MPNIKDFRHFRLALLVVTMGGLSLLISSHIKAAPITPKPRVVVTADPELDDSNSLVR